MPVSCCLDGRLAPTGFAGHFLVTCREHPHSPEEVFLLFLFINGLRNGSDLKTLGLC